MFTEEDNRAIETFTIETVGESAQEAAEREARKREIYEMRMEMLAKYSNRFVSFYPYILRRLLSKICVVNSFPG